MEILKVVGSIYCTVRHPGLNHRNLRVLKDVNGRTQVAVDTCHASVGNWVFVVNGSAARYASGDPTVLTDLTIGGIIDEWDEETVQSHEGNTV